ncbi:MAG: PaaI family thioesterase [Brevefilum sp.]
MDFYTTAPGVCRAEMTLSSQFEGYPGIVHGGIIASILDETGGRALMEDPDHFMVTAQLNVRYRKPVPTEKPLVAIGTAGDRRGRVSHAHSEILSLDGDVLAEADLVLVDIPEEQLADVDPEALGWKVYSDEEGS